MGGESSRRDGLIYFDLHVKTPLRTWPSPRSSPRSSPTWTPSSSAIDSPSCSSCSSTPFSYLGSTQSTDHEALLPGIPDDLAFACLLRLPLRAQGMGRVVCHRWKNLLLSDEYIQARRSGELAEPWLLVFAFNKASGKIQWQAWDAGNNLWHVIEAMPCDVRICPFGSRCVANTGDGSLFVCGGMASDVDCPLDAVLKYDLSKNSWIRLGSLHTPRSFFACGMIDSRIYAAGGNSAASQELNSAEVYDPIEDQWLPIANMGASMCQYDAAVMNGKLYVTEGWHWPVETPKGQIYDPKLDTWEQMPTGMLLGWTGPSVVMNDCMYVISEQDYLKLKSYDCKTDTWSDVGHAQIPPYIVPPLSVSTINGKLVIVAKSLHLVVGTIKQDGDDDGKPVRSVEWEFFETPRSFFGFVPSHSVVLFA